MHKIDEVLDPRSCLNRAGLNEMVFTLLARDPAAPVAIREWIRERIRLGKNKPEDAQILEAQRCLETMDIQNIDFGGAPRSPTGIIAFITPPYPR